MHRRFWLASNGSPRIVNSDWRGSENCWSNLTLTRSLATTPATTRTAECRRRRDLPRSETAPLRRAAPARDARLPTARASAPSPTAHRPQEDGPRAAWTRSPASTCTRRFPVPRQPTWCAATTLPSCPRGESSGYQLIPEPATRPRQQDLDAAARQPERVCNVLVALPFDVGQPQQRPLARFQRSEFTRHAVVVVRFDVRLGYTAQTIQPRRLLRRPPPAVGEQVAADAEDIAPQLFVAEFADVGLQQPAECLLHQVVSVGRLPRHAIQVGPERARVVLIARRKRALVKARHELYRGVAIPRHPRTVDESHPLRQNIGHRRGDDEPRADRRGGSGGHEQAVQRVQFEAPLVGQHEEADAKREQHQTSLE